MGSEMCIRDRIVTHSVIRFIGILFARVFVDIVIAVVVDTIAAIGQARTNSGVIVVTVTLCLGVAIEIVIAELRIGRFALS